MKRLSLAVFALTAIAAAMPQTGTLLRRTLKANAVDTYTIVDRTNQLVKSPIGETAVTLNSTRTFVLTTKTVDDKAGTALIEATTTFDKLESDSAASNISKTKPGPITQTGKIDVRGRLTFEHKFVADKTANLLSAADSPLQAGNFIELPEKAVKVGDTWNIVVPKNPMVFDEDQTLAAKLTGEKVVDEVPVWIVSIRGTLRSLVDTAKIPGAKPVESALGSTSVRIDGTDDIVGEGLIEKSSGRTISMISRAVSKKTLELVEAGIKMETTGTLETTVKLKKPGAP